MNSAGKIKIAAIMCFFIFLAVPSPVYAKNLKTVVAMVDGYDNILPFEESERAIRVVNDGMFGLIGLDGKLIVKPAFSEVAHFSEGYAAAKQGGLWGYITESGATAIPFEYSQANKFEDGLAVVVKNGKYGAIDGYGRVRIPLSFEKLGNLGQGLYPACSGGKWGYINRAGVNALPFTYDGAKEFCEGYAAVRKGSRWGAINKAGTVIAGFEYDFVGNFHKGFAEAVKGSLQGVIDRNGIFYADRKQDDKEGYNPKYTVIERGGKKGVTGTGGTIIIPVKFAVVVLVCDKYVVLSEGNKCGLYELTSIGGNLTFEKPEGVSVMLDGVYIAFDQKPVIENGRVMAPLRHISDSLRAEMTYDLNFTTIAVKKGDVRIVFNMGSDVAYVNGVAKKLDCSVRIIGGRTYVPVRFIADSFGFVTEWQPESGTVVIYVE